MLQVQKSILARRYNVIATKKDGTDTFEVQFVGLNKARQIRAEYRKHDYIVNIFEDVTIGRDGKEIVFPERKPLPEPTKNPPATALLTANRAAAKNRNKIRKPMAFEKAELLYEIEHFGYTVYRNGVLVIRGTKSQVSKRLLDECNKNGHSISEYVIKKNGKVED
jgi:hypothetical protein